MRPGTPLVILWSLWSLAGITALFAPSAGPWWAAAGGALAVLAAADAIAGRLLSRRGPGVRILREAPDVLSVNVPVRIVYGIEATGKAFPRYLRIYEDLPGTVRAEPYPIVLRRNSEGAAAEKRAEATWTPLRRGSFSSAGCRLESPSPLGLFRIHSTLEAPHGMMVLPDLGLGRPSAADALERRRELVGQVPVRRRGQGTDFKELRDYMPGDSVRHIDWRATSRRSHPVVRTFQDDRDQQLLIVLDGGYRLHQKDGEGLQFDKALQAALRLSRVALDHGDSVGMYAYGEKDRWIPPGKGHSHFWTLVRNMYDFESAPAATSPAAALERVLSRLNRRTLLIFITNLREEDGEVVSWMLPLVRGRHLMMAVTLREEGAEGPAAVETEEDALLFGASKLYREQRTRLRRYWEKQGILTLDALPDHVTGRVINRYLALKGAGVL